MAWILSKNKIMSDAPLLLHNGELANPLFEGAKALKAVTSKRKKTDKDHEEMAKIEWFYGLHLIKGFPCVTPEMVEATLVAASKLQKLGKDASRGITCPEPCIIKCKQWDQVFKGEPITGMKKWDEIKDTDLVFMSMVRVGMSKVNRTRPRFMEWSLNLDFMYEDTVFNASVIKEIVEQAGSQIGFGDWRPKYGRFHVVSK